MLNEKFLSVIIPVHNNKDTIARTILSIISNQKYIKEVIFVNDRDEQETSLIATKLLKSTVDDVDILAVDNIGNPGPGPARKIGLLRATGEWVTFIDADDCYTMDGFKYLHREINQYYDNEDPEAYNNLYVVQSRVMFFESGSFNTETVDYLYGSCGGRFYKREFLINNDLLPHKSLYYAEDEYFNRCINYHIELLENRFYEHITCLDYPLYQVFHEVEERVSFSFEDWNSYLIENHLKSSRYICERFSKIINFDFEEYTKKFFEDIFMSDFIFCWFMWQSLDKQEGGRFVIDFKDSLAFYEKTFGSIESLYHKYKSDPRKMIDLKESAERSLGYEINEPDWDIKEFLDQVQNYPLKTLDKS